MSIIIIIIMVSLIKYHTKVHSRLVDPQKNRHNYLITHSILKFPTPRRSSLQHYSFDTYIYSISTVGSKNIKLAVLP